jgi:hypothetical protein
MSYYPIGDDDLEQGAKFEASYQFAEREIRNGFVRKVLGERPALGKPPHCHADSGHRPCPPTSRGT